MTSATATAPERFLTAYNAREWERLHELLAPECQYEEVGRPRRQVAGAEQVAMIFRGWAEAAPGLRGEVRHRVTQGDTVALEVDLAGSRDAPFGDYRFAGRPPSARAALFFSLDGGRITRINAYYDSLVLFQLLGLVP